MQKVSNLGSVSRRQLQQGCALHLMVHVQQALCRRQVPSRRIHDALNQLTPLRAGAYHSATPLKCAVRLGNWRKFQQ